VTRLLISGAGTVTWAGLGLDALKRATQGEVPWEQEEPLEGQVIDVGRVGRINDKASQKCYQRWGQLDTYSRYGFIAARQALEDAGIEAETPGRAGVGVILGTAFGCMEENQRFDRYVIKDGAVKGASPLLFKGTVDNAPAGWIAVAWKLKGPNATFVSGDGAALEALWSAEGLLRQGRAPALVVGGVERFVDLHHLLRERDPERHGGILSEGAGLVVVEREDALEDRGRSAADARAELVGVGRACGSLSEARAAALERLGIEEDEIGLTLLATPDGLKAQVGEFHGAWGGVALCAALTSIEVDGWNGRPCAVVHAFGEGDEHLFAALRRIEEQT